MSIIAFQPRWEFWITSLANWGNTNKQVESNLCTWFFDRLFERQNYKDYFDRYIDYLLGKLSVTNDNWPPSFSAICESSVSFDAGFRRVGDARCDNAVKYKLSLKSKPTESGATKFSAESAIGYCSRCQKKQKFIIHKDLDEIMPDFFRHNRDIMKAKLIAAAEIRLIW